MDNCRIKKTSYSLKTPTEKIKTCLHKKLGTYVSVKAQSSVPDFVGFKGVTRNSPKRRKNELDVNPSQNDDQKKKGDFVGHFHPFLGSAVKERLVYIPTKKSTHR